MPSFRQKALLAEYRAAAILLAALFSALGAPACKAADTLPNPGLYRIEVRIALPNVQDSVGPVLMTRCIGADDLASGRGFFILSDNPLASCGLRDYEVHGSTVAYRISCPGPNRGSAVAVFETEQSAYRGTIKMNMGGKNMTMSESQTARRIGECQ